MAHSQVRLVNKYRAIIIALAQGVTTDFNIEFTRNVGRIAEVMRLVVNVFVRGK